MVWIAAGVGKPKKKKKCVNKRGPSGRAVLSLLRHYHNAVGIVSFARLRAVRSVYIVSGPYVSKVCKSSA